MEDVTKFLKAVWSLNSYRVTWLGYGAGLSNEWSVGVIKGLIGTFL